MSRWADLYLAYGDEDLEVARLVHATSPRLAIYSVQQAVEKWLKACLATKVNLDNRDAAEHLARDHDLARLLERVCVIYAPLLGVKPEMLQEQGASLVNWPIPAHRLVHLRYPCFNSRQNEAEGWVFHADVASTLVEQAVTFRRWATELRRF